MGHLSLGHRLLDSHSRTRHLLSLLLVVFVLVVLVMVVVVFFYLMLLVDGVDFDWPWLVVEVVEYEIAPLLMVEHSISSSGSRRRRERRHPFCCDEGGGSNSDDDKRRRRKNETMVFPRFGGVPPYFYHLSMNLARTTPSSPVFCGETYV